MKSKQQLQIGDVVKSLDFVSSTDCYYIGKIVEINEDVGTFRSKVISRIWEGKDVGSTHEFFVAPLPGYMLFDDAECTRLEVVA